MKIGKYELKDILGQGSFGVVYKAYDPRLMIDVALKTMNRASASNVTLKERFYREARAARKLRHPNIVTIYELDEHEGVPFIAMELCDTDLSQIIKDRIDMPLRRKLEIIVKTLKALHYAHVRGLVHRDIKPGNIGIVENDVRILDFGIVKVEGSDMTMAGIRLGTISYMAPEQLDVTKTTNAQTDLFSVGVMLYELLTYEKPFKGSTPVEVENHISKDPPDDIDGLRKTLPPPLVDAVLRSLEKSPTARFQSGQDFAVALQKVMQTLPKKGRVPSAAPVAKEGAEKPVEDKTVELATRVKPAETEKEEPASPPPAAEMPEKKEEPIRKEKIAPAAPKAVKKPARPKPALKPRPVKKEKSKALFYVAGAAAVVVISFLALFLFSGSFENLRTGLFGGATVDVEEGAVLLIASPWARIQEIRDEKNEEISPGEKPYTPFLKNLKPGSYDIKLTHPEFGEKNLKIEISPGKRTEEKITMFSGSPEDLLPESLKGDK